MNKAIYFQGPPGSGKTTTAGLILDSLWELRICSLITETAPEKITAEIESAVRCQKKYIHLDEFPEECNLAMLHAIHQALAANIAVLISSEHEPPEAMRSMTIWHTAQPFPYNDTSRS